MRRVVLGFEDEAAIDPRAKTVKKVLGHRRRKAGLQIRTVRVEDTVGR